MREGDKFQGGFVMKGKKFLVKIGAVVLLIVMIGGIVVSVKEKKESENAIHIVQDGRFNVNKDATFGLAIDQYLVETKWSSYENNDGRIVQIIGKKRDVTKEHTYTYELNYLVDRKNNTYTLYSAYKDGIKMNAVEELILKIKAFDLCDVDLKLDEENNQ